MKKTLAILASAMLFPATAAFAQEGEIANNAKFGDWIVSCEAASTSRTVCRLVQELTISESNAFVARFVAAPIEDGSALLIAQTPIGVYLPSAAVFRAESEPEGSEERMVWQKCLGQICEAAATVSIDRLAAFSKAKTMLFGYSMDRGADPIVLRVDVSRFEEALAALRN